MRKWFTKFFFPGNLPIDKQYRIVKRMFTKTGETYFVLQKLHSWGMWMTEADNILNRGAEKRWSKELGIDIPENVEELNT